MKELGYYDGNFGPLSEMQIPMCDRASWFGDGVYDAGPARHGVIFALDEHVDRFFRSAALLDITMPLTKDELKALLQRLLREMDDDELFVYYQVTRGNPAVQKRSHCYEHGVPGKLWVTLTPNKISDGAEPVSLITCEDTRFLHCNIKTLNLIPSVMASEKARDAGAAEAVLYRPGELVTECAHSNVHILKDGVLKTHPADNLILGGIARAHLLRACDALSIPTDETAFTLSELFAADEVIVTSSSNLCIRADRIDGKVVGGKAPELFERLRRYLLDEYMTVTA